MQSDKMLGTGCRVVAAVPGVGSRRAQFGGLRRRLGSWLSVGLGGGCHQGSEGSAPWCGGMTSLPSERSLHTFVDALAYNPVLGWSHSLGACLLKVSETCSDW